MAELADFTTQQWTDIAFCRTYAETWEISTHEMHYGWLAPGEDTLRLLAGCDLNVSAVLDIGCGMGENLIALSRFGARCFGLDISEHMIGYAIDKANRNLPVEKRPIFKVQDMRVLSAFEDIEFDIVISIYSLEYLRSLEELRDVVFNVYNRLKAGGVFVFCFSHQLQHHRHQSLFNDSARAGETFEGNLIYSFRDVVQITAETGFTIERIIEQHTFNPSEISYASSLKYPYHYAEGKNPCQTEFDQVSNSAPHTVIYRCRKPVDAGKKRPHPTFEFEIDRVRLWGEGRTVTDKTQFGIKGQHYEMLQFAKKDSLVALCRIADFHVWSGDLEAEDEQVSVGSADSKGVRQLLGRSLLAVVHRRLRAAGLDPIYRRMRLDVEGSSKPIYGTFLEHVEPIADVMRTSYPRQSRGILVFLNGEEPSEGKVSLESIFPTLDDHVEVYYMASGWDVELDNDENERGLFGRSI
jgi:SAM-dependent methyltransferase